MPAGRYTVPAVLDQRAEQLGDRVMMSIAGTPVTFAQMRDRSCAAANVLSDLGVQRGETVALFTGTCPEWVYFWLGAGDSLAEKLAAASSTPPPVSPLEEHDIGALFFTSGTTGPSKAVATTWGYLFHAAATVAATWEFGSGDVLWTAMPLFHLSAAPTVLAPMLVGGSSVLAAEFHPTEVWDQIRACGAAGFAGAGAMVSMLWNQPADPSDAELPIRFLSAAPIAADMYRDIERRYGCRIVTMYGMTEAFPIAYKSVSEEGVPGTSGRVNPAFDVRIVDPHGKPVPEGMVGEITCRARTPHAISEGYVSSASGRPLCRSTRIRTGFAPVTSAYWTTTRT